MDSKSDTLPPTSKDRASKDRGIDVPESGHAPGALARLLDIMALLRDPERGCPWDREQSFSTIAPHTVEEAYEVADAIDREDMPHLKDELGDLLFQVVFYAQLGREENLFEFSDIVHSIVDKMIRRHPHVFGDAEISSSKEQIAAWDEQKRRERIGKSATSAMDDVALALPALTRAEKIQKRAATAGFDWPNADGAFAKVKEELGEIQAERAKGPAHKDALEDEVGDLLFSCVNLSRHLGISPEQALRRANEKFVNRFKSMERRASELATPLSQMSLEEMDALWETVKREDDDA